MNKIVKIEFDSDYSKEFNNDMYNLIQKLPSCHIQFIFDVDKNTHLPTSIVVSIDDSETYHILVSLADTECFYLCDSDEPKSEIDLKNYIEHNGFHLDADGKYHNIINSKQEIFGDILNNYAEICLENYDITINTVYSDNSCEVLVYTLSYNKENTIKTELFTIELLKKR
jgi:effector-binding domain-containing protein